MGFWTLLQILVNLTLFAAFGLMWVKLQRPAKDDPRLSKGLQLLSSKIAVLEDLSDRTEVQVSQLTALLENKCREIQEKIAEADRQISRIDASAKKSLEVASIFQDRIPHTEILERQNTIKYVTAARLAHQGLSVDQIASQVDLSRAEIEFIAKVNRDRLQFSEEDLPEWARSGSASPNPAPAAPSDLRFSLPRESFQPRPTEETVATTAAAESLMAGQAFLEIDLRSPTPETPRPAAMPTAARPSTVIPAAVPVRAVTPPPAAAPVPVRAQTSSGKTVEIRPVQFPRIDNNRDMG